jgi:TRAP-type transport system periplasmic protein
MSGTRLIRAAGVALLAALALQGCSLGGGNKAGGPGEPIVLRMATVDGEPGHKPQVDYFVNRVESLSHGNVQIEMVYGVGNYHPDAEQQVVRGVAAGTYDLGDVGTRVFDSLGVTSFRALTAPMLVDNYALENALIQSGITDQMLRGLDGVGVVGLGVIADGLRKPIGVNGPIVGAADWRGIAFGTFKSRVQEEAIRALGATPAEVFGPYREEAINSGTLQGFEMGLRLYQRLENLIGLAPYVTANVNLWPQMDVLLANPDRLDGVTSQQRDWLVQAVQDAARATRLVEAEADSVSDLCTVGARFTNASDADIAALRDAFASVYAALQEDPQTAEFISEIEQLKQRTSPGQALVIPEGCTGAAASAPPPSPEGAQPKTTEVTLLDGVWEVTYSMDEFVAADPDPSEVMPENYGHFTVTFRRGIWENQGTGQSPVTGTYAVVGDTITFYGSSSDPGAVWSYKWSVYRDTLTFEKLGGQEPGCSLGQCEPTVYVVKPWRRVSL